VGFNGASVDIKGQDKFSEVKQGSVSLCGVLIPSRKYPYMKQISDSITMPISLLRLAVSKVYIEPVFDTFTDSNHDLYYCVPFAHTDTSSVVGLVLVKTNEVSGQYGELRGKVFRRAGLFDIPKSGWSDLMGRPVQEEGRLLPGTEGSGPVWEYDNYPLDQGQHNFDYLDMQWIEKHSENFVII
jgi:hypothetical protein